MRLVTCFLLALLSLRADSRNEILARMDADSKTFQSVKANLTQIEYTAAIKDRTEKKATLALVKTKKGGVAALVDYKSPDPEQFLFKDNKLQQYLPKVPVIQEYDLGKHSSVVNQFLMLAFGSSGQDLAKNYTIKQAVPEVLDEGVLKGVKATRLELIPKSPDALKYMQRIEFWVPEGKGYAVQLKIYAPSGDTNTAMYSAIELNPASLKDERSVELNAPKSVAHEKH